METFLAYNNRMVFALPNLEKLLPGCADAIDECSPM
jgi:hypothetical protein